MRKCVFVSIFVFFLMVGCGSEEKTPTEEELAKIPFATRDGLPECSGGLVLTVAGEIITSDEIAGSLTEHFRKFAQANSFERFRNWAGPQLENFLIARISNILLYDQAKKEISGEQIDEALERASEKEVRRFINSFDGDYAKAEEQLKKDGMDWKSFKEFHKKTMLTQHYVSTQLPDDRPITYSELIDYYNQTKQNSFTTPAALQFRLIDIEVEKLQPTDPNQTKLEQARELTGELAERIKAGEDFSELAKRYSHGHRRLYGGLWKPVQPDSLAEPYNVLASEAQKLHPDQSSEPIEAGGHIFIMKLVEKKPETVKPFEEVQEHIEEKILADRQRQAREKIGTKLIEQAAIANKDEFTDYCLQEIYRLCNQ